MKVAFRVDAGGAMGIGHFMRCLTLAKALISEHGAQAFFVCRQVPDHLCDLLRQQGIAFALLKEHRSSSNITGNLTHSTWLNTSQQQDANDTIEALTNQAWDWIVVDHYALDIQWEEIVRDKVNRLFVIDDLADRQHSCDMLLDQNFYKCMDDRYTGKVPSSCQFFLGPRYALLRKEFQQLRASSPERTGLIRRILVFFGGTDTHNHTQQAITALSGIDLVNAEVDVVIGALHPYKQEIETACASAGFHCYVQTPHMAQLAARADLAICAGGSAVWERCCLGLPALVLSTAKNQDQQVKDAAEAGYLYAPAQQDNLVDWIQHHTSCLIQNPSLRLHIGMRAMQAVDGLGAQRIADAMQATWRQHVADTEIDIRLAKETDAPIAWEWRNSESTRIHSLDPSPISLDVHLAWWQLSLLDSQRILLMGAHHDQAIGVLRFDINDDTSATVSIFLAPKYTGRGLGRALLRKGMAWLQVHHPYIQTLSAAVLPQNTASKNMFRALGFMERQSTYVRKLAEPFKP